MTAWNWHAVFADQGLLYYWTKYIKKDVSIIIGDEVEHWTSGQKDDEVILERIDRNNPLHPYSCMKKTNNRMPPAPYRDFHHFTGNSKPWEFSDLSQPISESAWRPHNSSIPSGKRLASRINMWRATLLKVQQDTSFNFTVLQPKGTDANNQATSSNPPVGRFSTYQAMISHIKAKKFFGWQHYEQPDQEHVAKLE
jgi:hypothetical protein